VMTVISGNSKLAIIRYFLPIPQRPLSVLINALRHFLQPSIQCIDSQLPLPSQSFSVHYPSITLSFQIYHLRYNQRR
jgi:hypothetical protein